MHPYQSRTRSRDRRLAQPASVASGSGSSAVSWIVAAGFLFILGYAFVRPILDHLTGGAL